MSEQAGLSSLFTVEERGIEPVPPGEQTGHPLELFWVWFAANLSILGLPLGAWVVYGGLNVWQLALAAAIGAIVSFAIVGIVSIAGQRSGAPTLTVSRAVFGPIGNIGPTFVAIVSRWGWETVNAVTACYALLSVFTIAFGTSSDPKQAPLLAGISVVLFIAATLFVSGLGHSVLLVVQKWATWVFGVLTVIVVSFLLTRVDWDTVLSTSAGSTSALLVGIGVVASGTGLAWANSGADIARYQSRSNDGSRLVAASALGAGIPLIIMITTGGLITLSTQDFDPNNPLSSIPALLPSWMAIPFLIAAFAGLLLSNNISVYSSGLTLLTVGIKAKRIYAVGGDLMVSLVGSLAFMFLFDDFYGPFINFILLLAIPLTAWLGVFLVDMIHRRTYDAKGLLDLTRAGVYWYSNGINWRAAGAWLVAIVAGFAFFLPPLNDSYIGANGLAWLVTLVISAVAYAAVGGARASAGQEVQEARR